MYQKNNKKNDTSSICQNMMKLQSKLYLISHVTTLLRFKHGERLPQHFLHGLHHEHVSLLICISQI